MTLDPEPAGKMDRLARRLRTVALALVFAAILAAVIDGLVRGLTFAVLARWAGAFLAAWLLGSAAVVAIHAGRQASAAQRTGERLSAEDVGFLPRRRRRG